MVVFFVCQRPREAAADEPTSILVEASMGHGGRQDAGYAYAFALKLDGHLGSHLEEAIQNQPDPSDREIVNTGLVALKARPGDQADRQLTTERQPAVMPPVTFLGKAIRAGLAMRG